MAESEDGQEKTEDPTARKKQKAREDGQVPQSKEASAAAVMIMGALILFTMAHYMGGLVQTIFNANFSLERDTVFDTNAMFEHLGFSVMTAGKLLMPLFLVLLFATFVAPTAMGSLNFSTKAWAPKLSRMDPIQGVKKIFSVNGLMELVKSLAKFAVIASVGILMLYLFQSRLMALGLESPKDAIVDGLTILATCAIFIACSLLIIVAIDVPFQIWNHNKQLKMTKQEVKDEMKDTEGKPEVKSRIRRTQQEMAQQRMMSNVPEADVVITNPDHYSVALKYDPKQTGAPILIAKGVDSVAFRIREVAKEHEIVILSAPPLARAIYFNTKLDQEIPEGLYLAVAQVLAYVFQINQFKKGRGPRPGPQPPFPVPEDLRRD